MSDFQHAYEPGVYVGATEKGVPILTAIDQPDPFNATVAFAPALQNTWQQAVNPPLKLKSIPFPDIELKSIPFPDIVTANHLCPGPLDANGDGVPDVDGNGNVIMTNASPLVPRPCVEAINISHSSMWVVNYRNEPVGLRVFDPNKMGPDGEDGAQADGDKGDLAFAFQSRTDRALPQLNTALGDTPYPTPSYCSGPNGDGINCDRNPGDPFTPIMRAYEHDEVKIKVQVGATEEQHQTSFHGLKWLSNGSGFGRSPIPDRQDVGNTTDYFYAQDATRDGIWSGTWGLLRSYKNKQQDLFELPENNVNGDIKLVDENNFDGVCPKYQMDANGNPRSNGLKGKKREFLEVPLKQFNVAAVLANKVLRNDLGVTIPANIGGDSNGDGIGDNVGGPLNGLGGTLVYNRRGTVVPDVLVPAEDGEPAHIITGGAGPLNDPTAMLYVRLEDLEPRFIPGTSPDTLNGADGVDDRCQKFKADGSWNLRAVDPECPLQLKADAPVEPLVLRANAGDCIDITLHNKFLDQATANSEPVWYDDNDMQKSLFERVEYDKLVLQGKSFYTESGPIVSVNEISFDRIPDLAGWQDLFWVVNRDMFQGNGDIKPVAQRRFDGAGNAEMHYFNNNLIRPSAQTGIHAQLVEYDMTKDDGVVAGGNRPSTVAGPRAQHTYRYYAGHIDLVSEGTETVGDQGQEQGHRHP